MEDLVKHSGSILSCRECGQIERTMLDLDRHIFKVHNLISISGVVYSDTPIKRP